MGFASFNQQFRWITYHLLASNCVCPLEVQKAYTKSIDPELRWVIHIYLVTEKVPHISGEAYTVEQVREAAEYIFEGNDPRFEILGPGSRLKNSMKATRLFSTTDKAAEQQRTDQSLQDMSTLVSEEVNKGLTVAPAHVLPPAPGLPPVPAPVTVQPPANSCQPSVVRVSTMAQVPTPSNAKVQYYRLPEDRLALDQMGQPAQLEQDQMFTHPPASVFLAYSTSCLSKGPNQWSHWPPAPPLPVPATLPCVLEPHIPTFHPNISAVGHTPSTQVTPRTTQETAMSIFNSLLAVFI